MITPPWVAPQLFSSSGRLFSDTTACSLVVSISWMPRCSVNGILTPAESGFVAVASGDTGASVDGDDLAADVARGIRGEQRDYALEIFLVA